MFVKIIFTKIPFTIILFSVYHRFVEHIENTFTILFGAQMIIVTIGLSIKLLQVCIYL